MSLDPQPAWDLNAPSEDPAPVAQEPPRRHPLLSAGYALVALGTGLVLALAPWADTWNFNSLQGLNATLEYLWDDSMFRSALSVLGGLNLLIALRELVGLFRAAPQKR